MKKISLEGKFVVIGWLLFLIVMPSYIYFNTVTSFNGLINVTALIMLITVFIMLVNFSFKLFEDDKFSLRVEDENYVDKSRLHSIESFKNKPLEDFLNFKNNKYNHLKYFKKYG